MPEQQEAKTRSLEERVREWERIFQENKGDPSATQIVNKDLEVAGVFCS